MKWLATFLLVGGCWGQSITYPTSGAALSGFSGNVFTSTGWASNTFRVCYTLDSGYPAEAPGYGAPYSNPLAANYARGCTIQGGNWALPWSTFRVAAGGNHSVTATAYDVLANVVATSSAVPFTVTNLWPVSCSGSPPAGTVMVGTQVGRLLPVTITLTGPCATDTTMVNVSADGIPIGANGSLNANPTTYQVDTSVFQDGFARHFSVGWLDQTNYTTVPPIPTLVQGAGEGGKQVTTSNASMTPWSVSIGPGGAGNCGSTMYMATSGTLTCSPTLLYTDGTTAAGITFDYLSLNTAVATVAGSTITATSSCPALAPCSAQIAVMGESAGASCNDLALAFGNLNQVTSACYVFTPANVGGLIHITTTTGGWLGSIVARITAVDPGFNGALLDRNVASSMSATAGHFVTGPTAVSWVQAWPTNGSPCWGSDGAIHSTCNSTGIFVHSLFQPQWLNSVGNATLGQSSAPYNYNGGTANGPVAEFDNAALTFGAYNTYETGVTDTGCAGFNSSTLTAFQTGQNAYIAGLSGSYTGNHNFKYFYLTGQPIMGGSDDLYACTSGPPSQWTTPLFEAALQAWKAGTYKVFGSTMDDEVDSAWGIRPLSGPQIPSGTNSWPFTSITASGGMCTVHATNLSINANQTFIVSGSVTTNLNSVAPALYTLTGGTTFICAGVLNGTYGTGGTSDPALQIQSYGTGWYNSNTDFIHTDAFSQLVQQVNASGTGIPITAAPKAIAGPAAFAAWMGNGTDGPYEGISQFSKYADLYPDNSQWFGFINSRTSANWLITGPFGVANVIRSNYGAYNPTLPLSTIVNNLENTAGNQGYNVSITSISGNLITFSAPHGVANVVQGDTRLSVTGNGTGSLNTNYYVEAVVSPTVLRVSRAILDFTPATQCTGGTATFSPSGYTETGLTLGTIPVSQTGAGGQPGIYLNGQFFTLAGPDSNLLKHRGETMTLSGCSDTNYNAASWIYLQENTTVTANNTYFFREWPSGSGSGGIANIQLDNTARCGVSFCNTFLEVNPDSSFTDYWEAMIAGAQMFRGYQSRNSLYTYDGAQWAFTDQAQANVQFAPTTFNLPQSNTFCFPHWEDGAAVPCYQANVNATRVMNRWAQYLLGQKLNAPDYCGMSGGCAVDCTLRSGIGGIGKILACHNATDGIQSRTFALSSFETGGQNVIQEITGSDSTDVMTVINAGTSAASVTLKGAQNVLFIFPVTFAGAITQPTVTPRLADIPGSTALAVRWGYDQYNFDVPLQNVINCGSSLCTIPADKGYGAVYGKFYYLNSGGAVIATSDVQTF